MCTTWREEAPRKEPVRLTCLMRTGSLDDGETPTPAPSVGPPDNAVPAGHVRIEVTDESTGVLAMAWVSHHTDFRKGDIVLGEDGLRLVVKERIWNDPQYLELIAVLHPKYDRP